MKVRAIIPVKSFHKGKGRLSTVLGVAERNALNIELLDHMLSVTAAFPGASRTIVISPDQVVLDRAEAAGVEPTDTASDGHECQDRTPEGAAVADDRRQQNRHPQDSKPQQDQQRFFPLHRPQRTTAP